MKFGFSTNQEGEPRLVRPGARKIVAAFILGVVIFADSKVEVDDQAKDFTKGLIWHLDGYEETYSPTSTLQCSGKQEITAVKGDTAWGLEQKNIKGADLVLRDQLDTVIEEQHPGNTLQPGDIVVLKQQCSMQPIPQN